MSGLSLSWARDLRYADAVAAAWSTRAGCAILPDLTAQSSTAHHPFCGARLESGRRFSCFCCCRTKCLRCLSVCFDCCAMLIDRSRSADKKPNEKVLRPTCLDCSLVCSLCSTNIAVFDKRNLKQS